MEKKEIKLGYEPVNREVDKGGIECKDADLSLFVGTFMFCSKRGDCKNYNDKICRKPYKM